MDPKIGCIVTGEAACKELHIFAKSLEPWHPKASLYILTDDTTPIESLKWKGSIHIRRTLSSYRGKQRPDMDALPGKVYRSMWTDYMYEKLNALEWMLETEDGQGAWFLDSDITFLAPLPEIPATATLALSPHCIPEEHTKKYGFYNAGFLWMKDTKYLHAWRQAGHSSRYYEQAALEDIATLAKQAGELYEFPVQVNFGWWRMYLSPNPKQVQEMFSLFRKDTSVGVRYDGKPLQSVHTHWFQSQHAMQTLFNEWFHRFLQPFATHAPIKKFVLGLK
jgi:hypothetical protein